MKTYKNLYPKICSFYNLEKAFKKAKKGKRFMPYVIEFEKNKIENLLSLKKELDNFTYESQPLVKFIINDPKTRVIRKSNFRDRIVHHAVVNVLEHIYENIFIFDSYANRKNKGTLAGINRFDKFKRKVSKNGSLVKFAKDNNMVKGYILKADIRHFFDSVNQFILLNILKRKIKDERLLWLINKIIKNFPDKEKGMPLGNMTSQFFANVYLNELDYFIKHNIKAKYYVRYVDDFVILHENKKVLVFYKEKIEKFLETLKLELHQQKSKIFSFYKGVNFLGFKILYNYKLVRKRNLAILNKRLKRQELEYEAGLIELENVVRSLEGWFAYAIWGNTYNLRKSIIKRFNLLFNKD